MAKRNFFILLFMFQMVSLNIKAQHNQMHSTHSNEIHSKAESNKTSEINLERVNLKEVETLNSFENEVNDIDLNQADFEMQNRRDRDRNPVRAILLIAAIVVIIILV